MKAVNIVFLLVIVVLFSCNSIPKKATYALSSRFFYPKYNKDTLSTFKVIDELKPSSIEWTYIQDQAILNKFKKRNLKFSLAMNPQIPDSLGYTTPKQRIVKYNGELYVAPWMRKWKIRNPYWGCVNNPSFFKLFCEKAKQLAKKGAYAIIVDDALFNARLKGERIVGCFCSHCQKKFEKNKNNVSRRPERLKMAMKEKRELTKISRDLKKSYEDFQYNSVINFLEKWKKTVRKEFPYLLFYANNYNGNWNRIYSIFDGGIAELKEKYINKKSLDSLYKLSEEKNKIQMFTSSTQDINKQYFLMKYNTENNKTSILPWDVYISGKKRLYVNTEKLKEMINQIENNKND